MLAWLNCNSITRWEAGEGERKISRDSATFNYVAAALAATGGFLLVAAACNGHARAAGLLATGTASALLLAFLDRVRDRVKTLSLRTFADMVLLTPMVLLLR